MFVTNAVDFSAQQTRYPPRTRRLRYTPARRIIIVITTVFTKRYSEVFIKQLSRGIFSLFYILLGEFSSVFPELTRGRDDNNICIRNETPPENADDRNRFDDRVQLLTPSPRSVRGVHTHTHSNYYYYFIIIIRGRTFAIVRIMSNQIL